MRFASYQLDGRTRSGVVAGEVIHSLPESTTVLDLVRRGLPAALAVGDAALATAGVPLANLRLRPPLQPTSVRDFVAFEEHVEGVRKSIDGASGVPAQWYAAPAFYFSNPHALVATGDDVAIPPGCELMDYELEVAAVIARDAIDLTGADAHDAIFGYTIFNDWSARDLQRSEMKVGLGPAKGKDFASTLGPWLVTADELEGSHDGEGFLRLVMTVAVNGVEIGRDLLSNMGWTFAQLVAYASIGAPLRAGDLLGSGTCGNGGCLAELWGRNGRVDPPPLRPGDVVTMTVEGIGTITNRVVAGRAAVATPPARTNARERR